MEWLSALAKSLFSSIIESFVAYFEKEKAEAAKWEAKSAKQQLESIKVGKEEEVRYKKAIEGSKKKPVSVSGWNAGLLILLCVLPFSSGCFRFYVNAPSYRPVPPKIEKPKIPEDVDGDGSPDEFTEREQIIAKYATTLEAAYNAVRKESKKHNESAGFPTSE